MIILEKKIDVQRYSNIELFRIVAMVMIILFHCSDHAAIQITGTMPYSIDWFVLAFTRIGGAMGNCAFILITGCFMYNKQLHLKSLIKLWLAVFFYTVFSGIIAHYYGWNQFSFKYILSTFLPLIYCKYWFVSSYFVLIIFSPFINRLIANLKQNEHLLLCLMSIFILTFIPALFNVNWLASSANLLLFLAVYFIGAYIGKYNYQGLKSNRDNLIMAFFWIVSAWASIIVFKEYRPEGYLFRYIWGMDKIFPLLMAVIFLFLYFKNLKIGYSKLINIVASTVFGCYMLHMGELWQLFFLKWFNIMPYFGTGWVILPMVYCLVTVFALGMIIDLLRQKLIEKPILRIYNRQLCDIEEKVKTKLERCI